MPLVATPDVGADISGVGLSEPVPVQGEPVAAGLRQILPVDEPALDLEVPVDPDDQHLTEVAPQVEADGVAALEWRDRLDLDELVADPAVGSLSIVPVRLHSVDDCGMEFADIAMDLQVAPGMAMVILGRCQQAFENRNEGDIGMRIVGLQLLLREVFIDLGPGDPFAIIVDGIVVVPHGSLRANHRARIIRCPG